MTLPLHPVMVHFPVAFYLLETVLIGLWIFKQEDTWRRFALFLFRAAGLGLLASLAAGWQDAGGWQNIEGKTAEHFYGAVVLAVLQIVRAVYWHKGKPALGKGAWICFGSSLLASAALIYTAHHGGELVYGD